MEVSSFGHMYDQMPDYKLGKQEHNQYRLWF